MRFAALTALLELEGEVVQPSGGRLVVIGGVALRLARGPRIGGGGIGVFAKAHRLFGPDARGFEEVALGRRLVAHPGGVADRFHESGVDVSRVVELHEFRGILDDLGLADPLPAQVVEESGAAAEGAVGRDRQVVGLLIDEGQATVRGDPLLVPVQEPTQLIRGLNDEIRALERGIGRDLAEQVVAARIHGSPPSVRFVRVRLVAGWQVLASHAHELVIVLVGSGMIFEVGAHPLPEEHRVVAFEDPLAGTVAERAGALVGLQLVECRVVR